MFGEDKFSIYFKLGIITLILYCINIGVYFMMFYKPHELLTNDVNFYVIESANQTIMDINRDNLIFYLVFSFIICLFVAFIILNIITPVTEVNGILKAKECDSKFNVSLRGGWTTTMNTYKLTFELENGDEMSFPVGDKQYVTILEGNKGIIKYKKGIVTRYVGFYVTK